MAVTLLLLLGITAVALCSSSAAKKAKTDDVVAPSTPETPSLKLPIWCIDADDTSRLIYLNAHKTAALFNRLLIRSTTDGRILIDAPKDTFSLSYYVGFNGKQRNLSPGVSLLLPDNAVVSYSNAAKTVQASLEISTHLRLTVQPPPAPEPAPEVVAPPIIVEGFTGHLVPETLDPYSVHFGPFRVVRLNPTQVRAELAGASVSMFWLSTASGRNIAVARQATIQSTTGPKRVTVRFVVDNSVQAISFSF
jgi:hypothetical protein